jgi:hypothetical protein
MRALLLDEVGDLSIQRVDERWGLAVVTVKICCCFARVTPLVPIHRF